jgi:hypothetical protein
MEQPVPVVDGEASGAHVPKKRGGSGSVTEEEGSGGPATVPAEWMKEWIEGIVESEDEEAAGAKRSSELAECGEIVIAGREVVEGGGGENEVEGTGTEGKCADVHNCDAWGDGWVAAGGAGGGGVSVVNGEAGAVRSE